MQGYRQAEINKKRDLAAQVDIKKLEIMVAQRIRHHVKLAQFLRTTAGPPLLWLPKSRLDATDKLLEKQQTILQLWQVQSSLSPIGITLSPLEETSRLPSVSAQSCACSVHDF